MVVKKTRSRAGLGGRCFGDAADTNANEKENEKEGEGEGERGRG